MSEVSLLSQQTARNGDVVRDILRAQTHDAHEQLHEHASFVALFKQTISMDQYRALMMRFHGFYVPLDQAIHRTTAQLCDQDIGYDYAMRAKYLAQDLADLGFSAREIAECPTCDLLFDIVSPASLGGVLYVVEGSTLGAAPIDRAAQNLLSSDVQNGRRFWAWSRSQNKQRWSLTNDYLAELDARKTPLDPITIGARATFEALGNWLAPLELPGLSPHELQA